MSASEAREEWRHHWPVVLAACLGIGASSMHAYAIGLFIEPLQAKFGWARAQISAGPVMTAISCILLTPFVGALADRLGARRIAIGGLTAAVAMTCALALVGPRIESWYAIWFGLALIGPFVLPSIWTICVTGFFDKGRGLALGVALAGSGISSIITPLLTYWLIDRFEWRLALVGLPLFWGLVALPVAIAFLSSPRDRARRSAVPEAPVRVGADGPRLAGLLSRRFALLGMATFLFAAVVPAMVMNLVPILSWLGVERGQAAGLAAVVGLSAIAGRLIIGFLLDRVDARYLAALICSLPLVACVLLLMAKGSLAITVPAVLFLGFALGAEYDIVAYLASRHFPLNRFGLIFGTLAGIISFTGAGGPLWINALFDATGSYQLALQIALPLCPLAAIMFFLLGPCPQKPLPRLDAVPSGILKPE